MPSMLYRGGKEYLFLGVLVLYWSVFFICRTVYVAEFGRDHVLGYQIKPNNDLVEIWVTLAFYK